MSNLGCARNLVDGEIMAGALTDAGFSLVENPGTADIIVVNTCGFIESASEESVGEILELAEFKKTGPCRRLIVTGCLPERYRKDLADSLPEVDMFLGTGAYDKLVGILTRPPDPGLCLLPPPDTPPLQRENTPRIPSTTAMGYLKATEGCDRRCTYCIIPKLRGALRSRPVADIEMEARHLVAAGFRELVIIGQDTGSYGRDLGADVRLPGLLDALAKISPDVWVRFLYGSPDTTDEALIRTMAKHDNICPYFDIPIQHASDSLLKRMGRPYDAADLRRVFDAIRNIIPEAALRTTVMVGFPGETDRDFDQLMQLITDVKFDHLGAFIYSDADDLPSHRLAGHVPKSAAQARYDAVMRLQLEIAADRNTAHIGRTYPVLVEEQLEPRLFAGRTQFQAPEVDGIVYIDAAQAIVGKLATVRITDALEYDLRGEAL